MKKPIFLTLLILALFISVQSNAQNYRILSYGANIDIQLNGDLEIHERIRVNFLEQSRGIMREIPKSIEVDGKTQNIKLSSIEVDDHEYKLLSEKNNNVIRIGNPEIYFTGEKFYDISYTLKNVLLREDDHTAFQYNVVSDWNTEIDKVSYSVSLPKELDQRYNDYKVFTGETGANERNASIEKEGNSIFGHSYEKLAPLDNITIAIKFPIGYFDFPPPPVPLFKKDKSWILPLGLIALFLNFFRQKRKPSIQSLNETIYYPPEDMSPVEVGTFIDGQANVRDFISLLPYWADQNYIKIMGEDEPQHEYSLFFKKISELPLDVPEYEKVLFDGIFEDGDLIALAELKDKIYKVTNSASVQIKSALREQSLYDDEEKNLFHSGKMLLLSFFSTLTAILIIVKTGWLLTGIGLIIFSLFLIVLYFIPVKKSEKGQRLYLKLKGLKSFLKDGTGSELNNLLEKDPSYFNILYPYSIAFGIDKTWMNKMEDYELQSPHYEMQSPHWYYTVTDKPYPQSKMKNFSKSFDVDKISSVFKSRPGSSGSSGSSSSRGSSGGGSAGGGFGGGGSSW